MKSAALIQKPKSYGFWGLVLLAVVLGLLFWKSFLPDFVHFSNDGPLGQQMTVWSRLPQAFLGSWGDLNDIGGNAGAFPPDLTTLLRWVLGPVGYSKFLAPIALFILGLGAWTFFRQLKLTPLASTLGALAASLTSTFFSDACWGVASHQIAFGMDFFALALIVSNSPTTPWFLRWTLAGLLVGMNVMEAFDIGAIFSLFVAAFTLFHSLVEVGPCPVVKKIGRGIGRIAVIAIFAGFIAFQTVVTLVGLVSSSTIGTVGTAQNEQTKAQHWDYATQWSLPKIESLGIIVPGLFGYRMDTPKDMMEPLQNRYDGGNYWGAVGRDPALDRLFESGQKGAPPQGLMRFSGTGNYAGVLVILVAAWAIAQLLRGRNSVFPEKTDRRLIWFWMAVLIVSLLLAFGRFGPDGYPYRLFYALPGVSTIRNPIKFLFVFSWALVTIFAYGIHGLSRRYLEIPSVNANSTIARLKTWLLKAQSFDRNWISICVLVLIGSLLAWLIYALQKPNLVSYLKTVGFADENTAGQIAAFSISQVGWFILFLALAAGLFTLILGGAFAGRRAKWGGIFLGALLVLDLGRADLPWIIHWDYKQKYEVGSLNPIVNFLRDKPYEHLVADLHSNSLFEELYRIEWSQQLFPYYNIQSLDILQMPRMPEDLAAYQMALTPLGTPETAYLIARRWELTNTRYLLGPTGFLNELNEQLDPIQHRFRIVQRFSVVLKPGVEEFHQRLEELTAVPNDNGDYALFEFTGALLRAKLYSNWQVNTNDEAVLKTLADKNFDPAQTVLVSTPLAAASSTGTNQNTGIIEFKRYALEDPVFKGKKNDLWKKIGYCYAPKDIMFDTKAETHSVLLLNDKYDPNWKVTVDGKPALLLRCNFIMRGVYLTPGSHMVEFKFSLPMGPLYISLSAIGVGILLYGFLIFSTRRNTN